jgi:hypothetical protein
MILLCEEHFAYVPPNFFIMPSSNSAITQVNTALFECLHQQLLNTMNCAHCAHYRFQYV